MIKKVHMNMCPILDGETSCIYAFCLCSKDKMHGIKNVMFVFTAVRVSDCRWTRCHLVQRGLICVSAETVWFQDTLHSIWKYLSMCVLTHSRF